jgi:hypothetical protein
VLHPATMPEDRPEDEPNAVGYGDPRATGGPRLAAGRGCDNYPGVIAR